jgi:hypothetical protein
MAPGRIRSIAAAILSVALVWVFSAPMTPAGAVASWGGRVFESDRITPREGVVVSLAEGPGETTLRAEPTRADGTFTIDGAPTGTYRLKVETPEGVFVSSEPVELSAGANTPMALALNPGAFNAKREQGLGNGNVSSMTEYLIAGGVSLFALLVILEITEDDDETNATNHLPPG